jgi:hypothetical protein
VRIVSGIVVVGGSVVVVVVVVVVVDVVVGAAVVVGATVVAGASAWGAADAPSPPVFPPVIADEQPTSAARPNTTPHPIIAFRRSSMATVCDVTGRTWTRPGIASEKRVFTGRFEA